MNDELFYTIAAAFATVALILSGLAAVARLAGIS